MVCSSREFDGRVVDPKNQQPKHAKHAKTMYELRFKKRCGIFECNHYAVYSDAPVAPWLFLEGGGTWAEPAKTMSYNIPQKAATRGSSKLEPRPHGHRCWSCRTHKRQQISPTQAITLGINDDGHLDKAAEWRNGGQNSAIVRMNIFYRVQFTMHDFEYISSMCVHMDLDSWMHHDAIAGSIHDIMCTDPPSNTNQIRPLPAPDLKCRQQRIGNVHKFDSLLLFILYQLGFWWVLNYFKYVWKCHYGPKWRTILPKPPWTTIELWSLHAPRNWREDYPDSRSRVQSEVCFSRQWAGLYDKIW